MSGGGDIGRIDWGWGRGCERWAEKSQLLLCEVSAVWLNDDRGGGIDMRWTSQ